MKKAILFSVALLHVLYWSSIALAHYGMIIPSTQMVTARDQAVISLSLRFWHPMEGIPMQLARPAQFTVTAMGKSVDLLNSLQSVMLKNSQTWSAEYTIKRPGLYVFSMEPQPYWESAEDRFIIHYTKAVVTAFGNDQGWDQPIGLKTEIVPLAKPYGLYAGNVFQGRVLLNDHPVPHSKVEVEFYNEDGTYKAPSDYMTTQTIRADDNGVFTYSAPWPGWWGFAALNPSDTTISHDGVDKEVELGAVLWINFMAGKK